MINRIPAFKGFYATQLGKKHLEKMPQEFVEQKVKPAIELAENSKHYDLSLEDDGKFYISSEKTPKFTLKNKIISVFNNQIYYNAQYANGKERQTYIDLSSDKNAGDIVTKSFFPPLDTLNEYNLELFKIMENTYEEKE